MNRTHWALIGGCLVSIAAMLTALHDWTEAFKPAFVGGLVGVIGTQIGAIYTRKPGESRYRSGPPFGGDPPRVPRPRVGKDVSRP